MELLSLFSRSTVRTRFTVGTNACLRAPPSGLAQPSDGKVRTPIFSWAALPCRCWAGRSMSSPFVPPCGLLHTDSCGGLVNICRAVLSKRVSMKDEKNEQCDLRGLSYSSLKASVLSKNRKTPLLTVLRTAFKIKYNIYIKAHTI